MELQSSDMARLFPSSPLLIIKLTVRTKWIEKGMKQNKYVDNLEEENLGISDAYLLSSCFTFILLLSPLSVNHYTDHMDGKSIAMQCNAMHWFRIERTTSTNTGSLTHTKHNNTVPCIQSTTRLAK